MSPKVFKVFEKIINENLEDDFRGKVLEIGTYHWSLLDLKKFIDSERVGVNISFTDKEREILTKHTLVECNANRMPFSDNEFDCVLACSVFEHDKYFWKSVEEVRRITKKGGLFVVGLPVYVQLKTDWLNTTLTYKRHGLSYNADYYRFSEQAIREIILNGFEIKDLIIVRKYPNPYIVASGIKK